MKFKIDELIKYYLLQKARGVALQPGPDCPDEVALSDFISGLLAPEKEREIRRHLDGCTHCLELLAQVGRWFNSGADRAESHPPPGELLRRAKALAGESRETPGLSDSVGSMGGEEFLLRCKQCDTANPFPGGYCRFCGTRLPVIVCHACGRVLLRGSRFCSFCGRKVPASRRISLPAAGDSGLAALSAWIKQARWLLGALASLVISFFWSRYFLQFLLIAAVLGIKWIFDAGTTRTLIMIYESWRRREREKEDDLTRRIKERRQGINRF